LIDGESATGCTLGTAKSPIKRYPGEIENRKKKGKGKKSEGK